VVNDFDAFKVTIVTIATIRCVCRRQDSNDKRGHIPHLGDTQYSTQKVNYILSRTLLL